MARCGDTEPGLRPAARARSMRATCARFMMLVNSRRRHRIVGETAPVAAAERARKHHHGRGQPGRREDRRSHHVVLRPEIAAVGGVLGRQAVHVARRVERRSRQRRGAKRKRLRRRGGLPRHHARRHRTLLEAEDRLAGHAVEDEHQAHLRHLGDGWYAAAVARRPQSGPAARAGPSPTDRGAPAGGTISARRWRHRARRRCWRRGCRRGDRRRRNPRWASRLPQTPGRVRRRR